jgi:predicted secreted protein
MSAINSNDVTIYYRTGSSGSYVWKALVCGTDAGLSLTAAVIESKTKCGTTRKSGTKSWEMSFSGEVETAPNASTQISQADLFSIYDSGTRGHFAFQDVGAATIGYEGDAVITKLDFTAPTDGVIGFSATLSGDGDLVAM